MNYTKIVSSNPLKQWQTIVAEDLQVYTKNPLYVLAGKFRVFPLRIFWQTTIGGDKLIAFLIDVANGQGKLLVFFTFVDDANMIMEYHLKRNGYFCSELSNLLVLSLLTRIKKGGKHNVYPPLLTYSKMV